MNRRTLLAGAGALPVAGAIPAAPASAHPDAALIAAVSQLRVEQAHLDAWNVGTLDETEGEAAGLRWWQLLERIAATRARTAEGMRAKAEATRLAIAGFVGSGAADMPHHLALSLTGDMLGAGGGGAAGVGGAPAGLGESRETILPTP